jgi:hypothetical protein
LRRADPELVDLKLVSHILVMKDPRLDWAFAKIYASRIFFGEGASGYPSQQVQIVCLAIGRGPNQQCD